jgi:hypothetical protein
VWGAIIAGVLVIRLRYLLHFAVLEAALEGANSGATLKDAARGTAYCPSCEMPLLEGANFCVVCGTATRAGNKVTRNRNRSDDVVDTAPSLKPTPVGAAPRDNSRTAIVVGAVVAAIVLGGAIGQGVAAAGADEAPIPEDSPIVLEPDLGAGPTTEEPPDPADAPGPTPDPAESDDSGSDTESSAKLASFGGGAFATDEETTDPGGIGGGPTPDDTVDTSDVVDLGVAGFRVPDDWEVEFSQDGFAQLWGPGGYFIAYVSAPPASMEAMVSDHLNGVVDFGVQELEYTTPEAISLPTSAVVEAQTLLYRGLMATQQGGTFPVEGFGYYFITQDGVGITAFGLYEAGALDSTPALVDGYNAMMNDLVGTIQ